MINYLENYFDLFEAWQKSVDQICEQWLQQPAVLTAMRQTLDGWLALRNHYNRISEATGLSYIPFEQTFREFTNLTATSYQDMLRSCSTELLPTLAATPYEVVYTEDKIRLLHYQSNTERRYPIPLLIMCSLINRYYILDLTPGRSYVEYLLNQGFDVYIIDWGKPNYQDRHLSFEDYIDGYVT
ncbi:MAG: hypothetical protein AB1489_02625, partial [Acidobacteriota bacterium]